MRGERRSCHDEPVDRRIDYQPLFSSVTAEDITAYRAELAARQGGASATALQVISWVVGGVVVLVLVATIVIPSLIAAGIAIADGQPLAAFIPAALPLVMIIVAAFVIVGAVRSRATLWPARVRMHRFAAANGLVYEPRSAAPTYPGLIFGLGSSRGVTDHFRTHDGRYLDFGNYSYTTGSGKSRTTHRWGFLALHLDRSLPHMVLDSRRNNGLFGGTNLPSMFSKDQVLSLEGDFNEHFTLYCPREYERDALYVFTPDLMALLIDEAAPFDVEIVDRWLFVYSSRVFPLADPATYQRLLGIVGTVGAKTLSQTDRYVDERVGAFAPNIVAPQGQRLRRGVSVLGIIMIALFGVAWIASVVSSFVE